MKLNSTDFNHLKHLLYSPKTSVIVSNHRGGVSCLSHILMHMHRITVNNKVTMRIACTALRCREIGASLVIHDVKIWDELDHMANNNEKNGKSGIQVISRATAILRVLRETQTGMSFGQIAAQVGLPRSTVQRISKALTDEKFVISDPQGGGLRLGPELSAFAGAAQYNIVEHCRLFLTELTQKTGETADLSVMRGIGMTFLDQVPGTHRLTTVSRVDEVFPLTTTANGLSCLAQLPQDEAIPLIEAEWERNGTNGDLVSLLDRLNTIRKTCLAYDLDEHSEGISAIGFAFKDWGGTLHAFSVPMPSTRFAEMKEVVEGALLVTMKNVTKMIAQ
ncbi:MAG: IclR family transcriptional regulator [Rhodobacteraceae bacterium]|nr:IclR family transcriptional regulator [Paracoccaceae bacterium]